MRKDDILINTAEKSDLSLSYLYYLSKGLSPNETAKLCGNVFLGILIPVETYSARYHKFILAKQQGYGDKQSENYV